jgi:formylmethanofuran dehydrogenase subunit E
MTIVNAHPEMEGLLERTAALHKHLCPRQVLGVRMGIYAAGLLSIEVPQTAKRLLTFVETDGCFADGVSISTGCSMGHRTMRLVDYGKVAATFVDTHDCRALRCFPALDVRSRAVAFALGAPSRWHAQLAAYQQMPAEEIFQTREVSLTLNLASIIAKPGTRAACSACGEEILNQREVLKDGQTVCRGCAGESYWSLKSK